jgi:thioredoxin reductase (NADPH)
MPNEGFITKDDKGFILTGLNLTKSVKKSAGWNLDRDPFLFGTNVPGIFAAGDVRSGTNMRVAAEGSAGIYMVHQYLQTV